MKGSLREVIKKRKLYGQADRKGVVLTVKYPLFLTTSLAEGIKNENCALISENIMPPGKKLITESKLSSSDFHILQLKSFVYAFYRVSNIRVPKICKKHKADKRTTATKKIH